MPKVESAAPMCESIQFSQYVDGLARPPNFEKLAALEDVSIHVLRAAAASPAAFGNLVALHAEGSWVSSMRRRFPIIPPMRCRYFAANGVETTR